MFQTDKLNIYILLYLTSILEFKGRAFLSFVVSLSIPPWYGEFVGVRRNALVLKFRGCHFLRKMLGRTDDQKH